eukprot:13238881-Alexandrium_andersonii.AAC.1
MCIRDRDHLLGRPAARETAEPQGRGGQLRLMGLHPGGNANPRPDPVDEQADGDRRVAVRVIVAAVGGPDPALPGARIPGPSLEE